jgi:AmmeMemoRadiSam system protein B
MNEKIADIRPSPIAGSWYSNNPHQLREQVERYLREASLPELPGQLLGIIAPHAGHRYSGATAGYAFKALSGQSFDLVVILSPMHAAYPGTLLTSAHKAYGTPLGPVWIDHQTSLELTRHLSEEGLTLTPVANDTEHSLEIELPFLQCALDQAFQLLPVMVRSQSPRIAYQLGQALAQTLQGRNALLVASTDLSHFFTQETANQLDAEMLKRIQKADPNELFAAEQLGIGYACGVAAVAAALWATKALGANEVKILHHSTSGDVSGDYGSVVGYGAAAILKTDLPQE